MAIEPAFEDGDGSDEVAAERHQQIDVVEGGAATEAVNEVAAKFHGGLRVAAVRAEED